MSWQTARAIVAAVSRELRREGPPSPRGAQARAFELVSARLPAGPMTAEIAAEARRTSTRPGWRWTDGGKTTAVSGA